MRVDLLYPDECAAIERALKGQFRVIWIIGLSTGLRISDILMLKPQNFKGDRFYIREKKTGKLRRVYVRKKVKKVVEDFAASRSINDNDYLFSASRQAVWCGFKRAAHRAEIKKNIGTHSMRKSYSIAHIRKGYDISDLQSRLNHSRLGDTIGYITSNEALGIDETGHKCRKTKKITWSRTK